MMDVDESLLCSFQVRRPIFTPFHWGSYFGVVYFRAVDSETLEEKPETRERQR